jgi:hypothetical protein
MEEAGTDRETGQERFFVKLHRIKKTRKTKYFTQISIQVSGNCSFCMTTADLHAWKQYNL